ncbi:DnaJ-domain-containing protein 1 [Sphingomonas sp. BE138]|uniref:J domain-containing protein n=1 Tax=Sphingomonas sp. BE138 TaxID=2817845 RepID=UPI002858ACB1|nr:DnaJ domain-containing protein [Sphingomonas sp. BE138]MDR6788155.1 DnaJ-domain-containing protein 1 [Sphingomonas sp. BE138]
MLTKWIVAALIVWGVWMLLRKPARKKRTPIGEARRVLGVDARAGEGEIRAAHRRLMSDLHPDRGGSEQRARRVNAARDTLLAALKDVR